MSWSQKATGTGLDGFPIATQRSFSMDLGQSHSHQPQPLLNTPLQARLGLTLMMGNWGLEECLLAGEGQCLLLVPPGIVTKWTGEVRACWAGHTSGGSLRWEGCDSLLVCFIRF